MTVQTLVISSDADDVYSDNSLTINTNIIYAGNNGAGLFGGMRWTGVAIPQGALITSATMTLKTMAGAGGSGTTWGSWYGDAADNPSTWSNSNRPDQITPTTASCPVQWNSTDGTLLNHNVTSIIQEIVNRSGWVSGNALRLASNGVGDGPAPYYQTTQGYIIPLIVSFVSPAGGGSSGRGDAIGSAWLRNKITGRGKTGLLVKANTDGVVKAAFQNWLFDPNVTVALSGQSLTSSAGSIAVATSDVTVALTGQAISISRGSVTGNLSLAVTGQFVSIASGLIIAQNTMALTGQSLTVGLGNVRATNGLALSGATLAIGQGSITVATTDVTVALTGQSIAVSRGTLAPAFSLAATGQAASLASGTVTPTTALATTGQALTASQGSATVSTSKAITGQAATASQGALTGSASLGVFGLSVTVAHGVIAAAANDITVALTGQALGVSQGTLTLASSRVLIGQSATASAGIINPAASRAISGLSLVAAGDIVASDLAIGVSGQAILAGLGIIAPFELIVTYPLAGQVQAYPGNASQAFPITSAQAYPMASDQTYPLAGMAQDYPLRGAA